MTIKELLDALTKYMEKDPEAQYERVVIITPTGNEYLAGADYLYDALPGEAQFALFIATEEDEVELSLCGNPETGDHVGCRGTEATIRRSE